MEMVLANGQHVEVSREEVSEFITQDLIPNPYWRYSGLLTEEEWTKFLRRKSSRKELQKVARYFLTYIENLSFKSYLFDKSEGNPDQTREFNMPVIKKLRDLYQKVINNDRPEKDVFQDVCMKWRTPAWRQEPTRYDH